MCLEPLFHGRLFCLDLYHIGRVLYMFAGTAFARYAHGRDDGVVFRNGHNHSGGRNVEWAGDFRRDGRSVFCGSGNGYGPNAAESPVSSGIRISVQRCTAGRSIVCHIALFDRKLCKSVSLRRVYRQWPEQYERFSDMHRRAGLFRWHWRRSFSQTRHSSGL